MSRLLWFRAGPVLVSAKHVKCPPRAPLNPTPKPPEFEQKHILLGNPTAVDRGFKPFEAPSSKLQNLIDFRVQGQDFAGKFLLLRFGP